MIRLLSAQKLIFQDQEVFISSSASTKGGVCVVVVIAVSFHQLEEQSELREKPWLWSWLKGMPGVTGCIKKVVTFLELLLVLGCFGDQGAGV